MRVVLIVAALWGGIAGAAQLDLFSASVPTGEPPRSERELVREALSRVLVKLSGRAAIADDRRVGELLAAPAQHLRSLQYRIEQVPQEQAGMREQERLLATFQAEPLQRAVRERGLRLWSPERPDVLLWLAIERAGGEREMLPADASLLRFHLQRSARELGLPLLLPLQDFLDYAALDVDAVWGGFPEPLAAASARYEPDRLLLAAAWRSGDGWQVRWQLTGGRELISVRSHGATLDVALRNGLQSVADRLAAADAVRPPPPGRGETRLMVDTPPDARRYARVLRYLDSLSQLGNWRLASADARTMTFELSLRADRGWLQRALSYGDVLEAVQDAGGHAVLRYRLRAF